MTCDSMELLEVEYPAVEVLTPYLGWIKIDNKESEKLHSLKHQL